MVACVKQQFLYALDNEFNSVVQVPIKFSLQIITCFFSFIIKTGGTSAVGHKHIGKKNDKCDFFHISVVSPRQQ